MAKNKTSDLAKWVIVAMAVGGLIYNVIVTHTILKNDVKHIQADMTEIKQDVKSINMYLLQKSENE